MCVSIYIYINRWLDHCISCISYCVYISNCQPYIRCSFVWDETPFLAPASASPMAPLGQNTRLAASTHGHVFNLSDLGNCGVELWNCGTMMNYVEVIGIWDPKCRQNKNSPNSPVDFFGNLIFRAHRGIHGNPATIAAQWTFHWASTGFVFFPWGFLEMLKAYFLRSLKKCILPQLGKCTLSKILLQILL